MSRCDSACAQYPYCACGPDDLEAAQAAVPATQEFNPFTEEKLVASLHQWAAEATQGAALTKGEADELSALLAWMANYADGYRVFDFAKPCLPHEVPERVTLSLGTLRRLAPKQGEDSALREGALQAAIRAGCIATADDTTMCLYPMCGCGESAPSSLVVAIKAAIQMYASMVADAALSPPLVTRRK